MVAGKPSGFGGLISARRRYPGGTAKLSIFLTLSREDPEMARRRALAHPVPTGQTNLPIKLHAEYAPALPAAGKGQSGRLLRRPQRAYPAATVADFCTAVSKGSARVSERSMQLFRFRGRD
jgi:hypothetical protein